MLKDAGLRAFRVFKQALFNKDYGYKTTHFWGPVFNWGIVVAGLYDATGKGPEVISVPLTLTMVAYSTVFMRFAYMVKPRNYLLFSCHAFNLLVQSYQCRRGIEYQLTPPQETGNKEIDERNIQTFNKKKHDMIEAFRKVSYAVALVASSLAISKPLKNILTRDTQPEFVRKIAQHPAGPFTIHCWCPFMKAALSASNILEYDRPLENISTPQQLAFTTTGFVWARYSYVINPRNYLLLFINAALGVSGTYHLIRKFKASQEGSSNIPTVNKV